LFVFVLSVVMGWVGAVPTSRILVRKSKVAHKETLKEPLKMRKCVMSA